MTRPVFLPGGRERRTHRAVTRTRQSRSGSKRFDFAKCWPYALSAAVIADGTLELNSLWCIAEGHPLRAVVSSTLATLIGMTSVFWIVRSATRPVEPPKVADVDPAMAELIRRRDAMRRQHKKGAGAIQKDIERRMNGHLARVR